MITEKHFNTIMNKTPRNKRPAFSVCVMRDGCRDGNYYTAFVVGDELIVPKENANWGKFDTMYHGYNHMLQEIAHLRPQSKITKLSDARADKMWKTFGGDAVDRLSNAELTALGL